MEFNIPKCTILQIILRQQTDSFDYGINNIIIKTSDQHPYLGVYLSKSQIVMQPSYYSIIQ